MILYYRIVTAFEYLGNPDHHCALVAYACLLATQETEIRRIEVLKDHRNAM
jgi:hypothetical protein